MLSRVILVSDGLANRGVTDAASLGKFAGRAAAEGIPVTTVGLGTDFGEDLLLAIAEEGQGVYYYVSEPEEVPGIVSQEMEGLARLVAENLTAVLDPDPVSSS